MKRSPLIVELVGPAGAGKTTLSRTLGQRAKGIVIRAHPYVRRVGDIPFFAKNALSLLPTFLRLSRKNSRWLTRREIAWMTILKGWDCVLRQRVSDNNLVTILDHGPVFMLAQLHGFGPASLKSQTAEKWWSSTYNRWAATLDMLIWLDASDTILLDRIHGRDCWHRVKEKSEPEALEFLTRYRLAYEQVISMLTANANGPTVLRFDTAQESLHEIVHRILAVFGLDDGGATSCASAST